MAFLCFGAVAYAVGIQSFAAQEIHQTQEADLQQENLLVSCSEWFNVGSGSRCVAYLGGSCQCTQTYTIQKKYCSDGSSQSREVNHNTSCQ